MFGGISLAEVIVTTCQISWKDDFSSHCNNPSWKHRLADVTDGDVSCLFMLMFKRLDPLDAGLANSDASMR